MHMSKEIHFYLSPWPKRKETSYLKGDKKSRNFLPIYVHIFFAAEATSVCLSFHG